MKVAIIIVVGSAAASIVIPRSLSEVEARWYDTDGWVSWVNGLERVTGVTADWPEVGAKASWESGPAGRGRVRERVASYLPGAGQTLEVSDASITGRQSVSFREVPDGIEVSLTLDYHVTARSLLTPLIDRLFVRRAMETELRATLDRFAAETTGQHSQRDHRT
ncbi:MAG: SRPBCC family protein [Solirubrobacteraceae bacterium]